MAWKFPFLPPAASRDCSFRAPPLLQQPHSSLAVPAKRHAAIPIAKADAGTEPPSALGTLLCLSAATREAGGSVQTQNPGRVRFNYGRSCSAHCRL